MAKFKGIFDIEGTLQGMTFYKSKDGMMVRTKGGVSKDRIMNDPSFERTRENGQEFATCARAAKLFRMSILDKIDLAKDYRTQSRLIRLMHQVKVWDTTSPRGQRNMTTALEAPEARALFTGFDFNRNSPVGQLFVIPYTLDTAAGTLAVTGLIPGRQLKFPPAATEADVQLVATQVDFGTEQYVMTESARTTFSATGATQDVTWTVSEVPAGTGPLFYLLLIEFYQVLNGERYPLKNRQFNALGILAAE